MGTTLKIMLFIIGKDKSNAYKTIYKETGIPILKKNYKKTDIIINYGVTGQNLRTLFKTHPLMKTMPIINKFIGRSKFLAIKDAQKNDILVPKTKLNLSKDDNLNEWIEKLIHSYGGKGIKKAKKRKRILGKYYQKIITNRLYELRVHAFKWLPINKWVVQKKLGPPDQIAWNFHQGGYFSTIYNAYSFSVFKKAITISKKILDIRKMSFGAVDFIVSEDLKVYFIEINSAPGFSNLSAPIYINAFNTLKNMKELNWKLKYK